MWFLEGLSSQRDILQDIRRDLPGISVLASHRQNRPEITSVANVAFKEPSKADDRIDFIKGVVEQYAPSTLQAGRDALWYEQHRAEIEQLGVTLVTGAIGVKAHEIAEDKLLFARAMTEAALPVVPSVQITSRDELAIALAAEPFDTPSMCIKPARGIYGMGFWRLDAGADAMACFDNPDSRIAQIDRYLDALARSNRAQRLVLMPYLSGPECSVDMLVDKGNVIYAIGRTKLGAVQRVINQGPEIALAKQCASVMGADGLVNVQTRQAQDGSPVLLEINLRPSGGICFSRGCGVSLPTMFAAWQLGMSSPEALQTSADVSFTPITVRPVTQSVVIDGDESLSSAVESEETADA